MMGDMLPLSPSTITYVESKPSSVIVTLTCGETHGFLSHTATNIIENRHVKAQRSFLFSQSNNVIKLYVNIQRRAKLQRKLSLIDRLEPPARS